MDLGFIKSPLILICRSYLTLTWRTVYAFTQQQAHAPPTPVVGVHCARSMNGNRSLRRWGARRGVTRRHGRVVSGNAWAILRVSALMRKDVLFGDVESIFLKSSRVWLFKSLCYYVWFVVSPMSTSLASYGFLKIWRCSRNIVHVFFKIYLYDLICSSHLWVQPQFSCIQCINLPTLWKFYHWSTFFDRRKCQ